MSPIKRFLVPLLLALGAALTITSAALADHRGTRYYMVMFGTDGGNARSSHTFATFVKEENGHQTEELTISWLPERGYFGNNYTMPPLRIVPGRNYSLDETIAMYRNLRLSFWGPYEVTPELYRRAQNRVAYLNARGPSYKMMILLRDRLREPALRNQRGGAINCIMAVSDIGGYLDTGTAWGAEASSRVLWSLAPLVLDSVQYSSAGHEDVAERMGLRWRLGRR